MPNINIKQYIYIFKFLIFVAVLILLSLFFGLFSLFHISCIDSLDEVADSVFQDNNDDFVVIIDAGHGGEDGGAVSDSGIVEKDLNLDIAMKMKGSSPFSFA